ncbi:putative bifunctional diguanylate cyclase/phosphodiesterase [Mangrovicella endophytica]|uniref:putative bifunctional diguanylate cyclase/phosphodiesterase n=1 Tax=Mangrovicella endophytica TaxID=2066697 RepID=UPI0018E446AF|nr:EAL domain-containing protein [Mangrovicella endophytica]
MRTSLMKLENVASFYATLSILAATAVLSVMQMLQDGGHHALISSSLVILSAAGAAILVRARLVLAARIQSGERAEQERLRLLDSDALTGSLSRRAFIARLRTAAAPETGGRALLMLFDIDHFKAVNDGFGHAVGDQVLVHTIDVARRCFPGGEIGRLGGDEFAILLTSCDRDEGLELAARFLAELRHPRAIGGRQLSVGCSIGLAVAPDDAAFVDDLIVCADLALYESKRRGRGCATAFDASMLKDQKQRRFIERELRAAILMDELELHYQPLTNAKGDILGVEALLRWRHPLRGMIPPGEFIGIAEQSTLIDMLGEWVMRRAVRDAPWLPAGSIAINISGAQLKRDEIVAMVTDVLAEARCPAERFTFEITESVAVAVTSQVFARLQALRNLGLRMALDDFGTGNCGFTSLRSLPVDAIKIDRSYIQWIDCDAVASVVVSSLASIGRLQGLEIVAEGIETEEHLMLAKAAGCTVFQGFLLGRPAPLSHYIRRATETPVHRLAG